MSLSQYTEAKRNAMIGIAEATEVALCQEDLARYSKGQRDSESRASADEWRRACTETPHFAAVQQAGRLAEIRVKSKTYAVQAHIRCAEYAQTALANLRSETQACRLRHSNRA